jgi:hypothetical protein
VGTRFNFDPEPVFVQMNDKVGPGATLDGIASHFENAGRDPALLQEFVAQQPRDLPGPLPGSQDISLAAEFETKN